MLFLIFSNQYYNFLNLSYILVLIITINTTMVLSLKISTTVMFILEKLHHYYFPFSSTYIWSHTNFSRQRREIAHNHERGNLRLWVCSWLQRSTRHAICGVRFHKMAKRHIHWSQYMSVGADVTNVTLPTVKSVLGWVLSSRVHEEKRIES